MSTGERRPRRRTSTSSFGVGARESHDATAFYERFRPPTLSTDDQVAPPLPVAEPFVAGDSRHMAAVADASVALVVTSPPYFAGKRYEEELERDGVPSSYLEYLQMLTDVFADCVRVLEPGGRIAVNVANLGRKPYRSLSADVIRILEHDLGLLLRGELIWQKGEGASGSCAWGSFRRAANPVLRDVTERVVVASKGRFDRARTPKQRKAEGLPYESTVLTEDFTSLTLDLWSIPPESAQRVGHPAPFPVELPEQLIRLYTYADDLVLDPFMGSGSTLVAAARLGRRYVGYDLDPTYVDIARRRVADGLAATPVDPLRAAALAEGRSASAVAASALVEAGFTITGTSRRLRGSGLVVPFTADDRAGAGWCFELAGPFTSRRGGLARTEVAWRTLGRVAALRGRRPDTPVVVLTTELPRRGSEADAGLRAAGPHLVHDVVDVLSSDGRARLAAYAAGSREPRTGFWTERDLAG
jgi:site-specific DNA-methyltransferase (adenine-specific)